MENLQWDPKEWDPEVDFQLGLITSFFGYYAKRGQKVVINLRDVNREHVAWMKKYIHMWFF